MFDWLNEWMNGETKKKKKNKTRFPVQSMFQSNPKSLWHICCVSMSSILKLDWRLVERLWQCKEARRNKTATSRERERKWSFASLIYGLKSHFYFRFREAHPNPCLNLPIKKMSIIIYEPEKWQFFFLSLVGKIFFSLFFFI